MINEINIAPIISEMLHFRYRLLPIFCLFFIACQQDNEKFSLTSKLREDEALEDFQQLVEVLQANHPALYDFTPKNQFDSLVNVRRGLIDDSLTVGEFFNIAMPVVNQIGCSHTGFGFPNPDRFWTDPETKVLWFDVVIQDGKCFLLKEQVSEVDLKPGTEILSFNDHSISQLQQKFQQYISTDGDNKSTKKLVTNIWFNDYLAMSENFPDEYKVTYKIPGEDSVRYSRIKALCEETVTPYYTKTPHLSLDSARNVAVMTIPSFSFYENVEEFQSFVDSSFHLIKRNNFNNLILDLRNNPGGDPYCSAYLLTYLAQEPFTYFDQPAPGYDSLTKYIPLAEERFQGNLYTLTNGLCNSTTGHLCALLKYHRLGEFIGSETNGTYTCNDNSKPFTLENSGLVVVTARTTYSVDVQGIERFQGIVPDYEVEITLSDHLHGKDPVKDYAFQLIYQINDGR
ncbi:MAG: S41 family peptidase [Bacteroidota bacterium]